MQSYQHRDARRAGHGLSTQTLMLVDQAGLLSQSGRTRTRPCRLDHATHAVA